MRRIIDTDLRSFGELLTDLRYEATHLVRREIDLAKAEMTEKSKQAVQHSKAILAGAAIGIMAGLTLCLTLAAAAFALFALFTPVAVAIWLGPLVLTIVLGVAAWLAIRAGLKRLQAQRMRPDQTADSLQENQQWLQEKVS
ncbi:MAG: phage holin family protein [Phycisphaeraceae bacterium]